MRIGVSDDGAGIDLDAVRGAAIAGGLLSEAEAPHMDDAGLHALLFRPGFSTSERISETSGRGVGLDVVHDAVRRAGGALEVTSRRGEGTTFSLSLPLSAAMAPVLIVEAGGHPYALPAARVEAVLDGDAKAPGPTLSLASVLGLGAEESGGIIVLRRSTGRPLLLSVGRVQRRTDLLLRPLHPSLAALPGVAGVGVLGTGEPVVLLEPDGLG